ncbi:hypothetical protein, partial [Enterococcus faecium]|uniref:hypothetical protein n=1 Tax=Enterococcus faecium TaxID=1352 RepID=UPI001F306619
LLRDFASEKVVCSTIFLLAHAVKLARKLTLFFCLPAVRRQTKKQAKNRLARSSKIDRMD